MDYVWKALLTEFLGSFALVTIISSTVALTLDQGGSLVAVALASGFIFAALIYAWGSYSGGHFNPAVSFGFAVAGRMNWWLMIGYWIAQVLGGIAAAALVAWFFGTDTGAGASVGSLTNTDAFKAIVLEALLTFFLVSTFLLVTRNPILAVASGLAIGLVLAASTFAGFSLTGASLNPARSIGPAIFSSNLGSIWIYIVGPLIGALIAGLVYKLFNTDFSCCDAVDECGEVLRDACGNPLKECKRPLVDPCGNPITDCGEVQYENYTRVERKLDHHQQTWLSELGGWMGAHGADPQYVVQELRRSGVGNLVHDKWENTKQEMKQMQHDKKMKHHDHHAGDHEHVDVDVNYHLHAHPSSSPLMATENFVESTGESLMSVPRQAAEGLSTALPTLSPQPVM